MPEFPLENWEWSPTQQRQYAIEPFEYQCRWPWPHGRQQTLICAVPLPGILSTSALLFRRVSGAGQKSRNFVSLGHLSDNEVLRVVPYGCEQEQLLHFHNYAIDSIDKPAQLFQFPEMSAVLRQQVGLWTESGVGKARFRLPFRCERKTGAAIYHWLQAQQNDEHSEVHFSYQWANWSEERRVEYLEELLPALRELVEIMRLIARSEPEMNPDLTWWPRFGEGTPWVTSQQLRDTYQAPALLNRLQLWGRILQREFLHHSLDEKTIPLCVLETYTAYRDKYLTIEGEDATAHERLEARITLREWIHGKASPEATKLLND